MAVNKYRNPFILGLWAPAYQLVVAGALTNDFLMGAMCIMATLGLLGAYVTEFPILGGLYPNELLHKIALSSLLGIVFGLVLWAVSTIILEGDQGADSSPISTGGKFLITWAALSVPAYPLLVILVSKLNKRDLEEEHRIRTEKKKNRKGGGPPIMTRDGF